MSASSVAERDWLQDKAPRRDALPRVQDMRKHVPPIRAGARAIAIVFFSLCALLEFAVTIPFLRRDLRRQARAAWLHRWSRLACWVLALRLTTRGSLPRSGLLVANHLSYLDIIALSSIRPCVFVAKSEVARWPLFGWLARSAGSIFVDRARRSDAALVVRQIRAALAAQSLVVLFPEGTSSDGSTVLPFKSALLQAAIPIEQTTAAAIRYSLPSGSVADEVCYWREMTLLPHLLNLCTKPEISVTISFAEATRLIGDRKSVALQLHALVQSLLAAG